MILTQEELEFIKSKFSELSIVDSTIVEVLTTVRVINKTQSLDFDVVEPIYQLEMEMYDKFPEISFDFQVTRGE